MEGGIQKKTPLRFHDALQVQKFADFSIVKISGYGEITLINELEALLEEAKGYHIQIITNGTIINKEVIKRIGNSHPLSFCISLDGNTEEMNKYRQLSNSQLERILGNIKWISNQGIPLEINSVLSDANTDSFHLFLQFLNQNKIKVMDFPFPVRTFPHMERDSNYPSPDQIQLFKEHVIDRYSEFGTVMPPRAYLDRLYTFLCSGKRTFGCLVPSFNIGIDQQGKVLGCPCGPQDYLGSILLKDNSVLGQSLELNQHGRWKECKGCFTHYEIINLYLEGAVSLDELQMVPSLSSPKLRPKLTSLLGEYGKGAV